MDEPRWVPRLVLDTAHLDQIREHGGLPGVRDEGGLEAALSRARNRWAYDPSADLAALAAAYGYGLTTGHPYLDGNKRAGFLAMAIFLGLNGLEIEAAEEEVVRTMLAVADGSLDDEGLAGWLRKHVEPLQAPPGRPDG